MFTACLQRWARVAGTLAQHVGMVAIEADCLQLERRVEYGVKAGLLPLVENLKRVGRIRGRINSAREWQSVDYTGDNEEE